MGRYPGYGYGHGGGICLENSDANLSNILLSGNSATSGGGIYLANSNPALLKVSIIIPSKP